MTENCFILKNHFSALPLFSLSTKQCDLSFQTITDGSLDFHRGCLMIFQDQPQHDGEASVPSTIRRSRQAPPRAADTSLGAASSSNPAAHQPTNRGRCGPLRTANRSLNDTARSWATKHNYFRESIHSWDRFQRKGERSPSSAESYSLPSSSPFRLPSCTEG